MAIPVPTYSYLANARSIKQVTCENCRKTYFYEQNEEGASQQFVGLGPSSKRAQEEAEAELQRRLDVPLVVPCPHCGQIQLDMIPVAQGQRIVVLPLIGMLSDVLARFVGLGAVIGLLMWISESVFLDSADNAGLYFALICGSVCLVIALFGFGTLRFCDFRRLRYDPNSQDLAARIDLGKRLAFDEKTAKRKALFPQPGPYQFSCECGEPIPARPSQAGAQTQCPICDKEVVIPTLEAIKNLPRKSAEFWERHLAGSWEQ